MSIPNSTKDRIISALSEIANDKKGDDLLPHQRQMVEAVANHLEKRNGSKIYAKESNIPEVYKETATNLKLGDFCQIDACVSSGKTRVIGKMAQKLIARGIPVLILEPTKLLGQQTQEALIEDIGIDKDDIGMFNGGISSGSKKSAVTKPILIATPDSLNNLYKHKEFSKTSGNPGYRPFVIVDETHERVQGPLLSKHIAEFKKHSAVVGLSGTDVGAHQTLYDGQVPVYSLPLVEAIETGILTMVNHAKARLVDVRIDDKWYKDYLKEQSALDKDGNVNKEMKDFLAKNSALITATNQVHLHHEDPHLGPIRELPTLVYVYRTDAAREGAKQANKLAKEMGINGFHAEHISGKMDKKEIDNILKRFAAGEINMLWNDRLIGLGYNERNVAVVHDLRNANVEQQFGRALRSQGDDYHMRYGGEKVALGISYRALTPEGDFVPTYTTVDVLGGETERYDQIKFPTPPPERFPKNNDEDLPAPPENPKASVFPDPSVLDEPHAPIGGEPQPSDLPDPHALPKPRFSSKEYDYPDGIVIHSTASKTREISNAMKKKRDELMGKAPENWMTVDEAQKLTGIDRQRWVEVADHIKPDRTYTPHGLSPKSTDDELVQGRDLTRKGRKGWILHTSLVEGVQSVEAQKAQSGLQTVTGYARQVGTKKGALQTALKMIRQGKSIKVGELSEHQRDDVEQAMPEAKRNQRMH